MQQEHRQHIRLPVESRVFIELIAPAPGGKDPGKTVLCKTTNVSKRGMRIEIGDEVAVGAILQIGVDLPDAKETLYLAGEVRWCHAEAALTGPYWTAGFLLLDAEGSDLALWQTLLNDM
jgi:hypothetical protein